MLHPTCYKSARTHLTSLGVNIHSVKLRVARIENTSHIETMLLT